MCVIAFLLEFAVCSIFASSLLIECERTNNSQLRIATNKWHNFLALVGCPMYEYTRDCYNYLHINALTCVHVCIIYVTCVYMCFVMYDALRACVSKYMQTKRSLEKMPVENLSIQFLIIIKILIYNVFIKLLSLYAWKYYLSHFSDLFLASLLLHP